MNYIVQYIFAILLSFIIIIIYFLTQFFVKNRAIKNISVIICFIFIIIIALYCYFEIKIPFLRTLILK